MMALATKIKIAIDTGLHETIGIDLVAMCVNDLVVQGAEPLFFLDYFATGRLSPDIGAMVVSGIAKGCQIAGCALIGGETAEMPGMYGDGDYDLAGFAVGAAERGTLLPRADIAEGDVILGLASSGVHSNGFSLVRSMWGQTELSWNAPAPFAPELSLARVFLEPTRIYVKQVLAVHRETAAIKALAHITGGGFVDNIPRVLPKGFAAEINLDAIPVLPVFKWLAATGNVEPLEMLRTFNCGIGMVVVVSPNEAETVVEAFRAKGETVATLGRITKGDGEARTLFTGTLGL